MYIKNFKQILKKTSFIKIRKSIKHLIDHLIYSVLRILFIISSVCLFFSFHFLFLVVKLLYSIYSFAFRIQLVTVIFYIALHNLFLT